MQLQTTCFLVLAFCVALSSTQRQPRRNRGRGGQGTGGGGGEGPFGDAGPVVNALMNDPFAFRRMFHPLANQRFMSNMYNPNFAAMSLMMDMEPLDFLLFGAMSGMGGGSMRPMMGRGRGQQPQVDPWLVALGIVDGADRPDPGQGRRGGGGPKRRGGGKQKRPGKAGRKRARGREAGQHEAGPHGQSEAGPRQ